MNSAIMKHPTLRLLLIIGLRVLLADGQGTESDDTYQFLDNGSIRLVGGSKPNEGRLEMYWNGQWGTVCDDAWIKADADVVCRQLGYPYALVAVDNAFFGEGSGDILLDNVRCLGHEVNLLKCERLLLSNQNNCNHSNDVGVICQTKESAIYIREGSIRLVGASKENAGRVEIYYRGSWGTVCDDNWDLKDADVVCKQLGFPSGALSVHSESRESFGAGEGNILLDQVSCEGSERYLTDCQHNGWYRNNCGHTEDAGVTCFRPNQYHPRLVNGTTWYEGRVEVWNLDHWEGVCLHTLGENEARAVCKELGFTDVHVVEDYEKFGDGFTAPASIRFSCPESTTNLASCTKSKLFDTHCEAAAISCVHDKQLPYITLASLGFFATLGLLFFVYTFFQIFVKMTKKIRTSSPRIQSISRQVNVQGDRSASSIRHNWQEPPSYDEVLSDPFYYPKILSTSQANVSQLQPNRHTL